MALTFFLLGLLYVVFGAVLIAALQSALPGDHHPRRSRRAAVLHVGQARAGGDGRTRRDAAGGAAAARHDRAPVRAGRPSQAEGRRRQHRDAQRLRARPLAQERDRLRHDRHHGAAQPRRARGRHGPRADPHRQPRRDGDDARLVLRDDRGLHRPVRLPVRRHVTGRRRRPVGDGPGARLARRLLHLVPADAGAVALPRVLGRPRRGADHGPALGAGERAGEDLRRHGADPQAGPARGERAERVLHLPGGRRRPASPPTRRWRSGSRRCSA